MRSRGFAAVSSDQVKNGKSVLIADDCLAINYAGPDRQRFERRRNERKLIRKIASVAGNEPHSGTVSPGQNPKAVMLDFVEPAGTGRRGLRGSRQTWLYDPHPRGSTLITQRHTVFIRNCRAAAPTMSARAVREIVVIAMMI